MLRRMLRRRPFVRFCSVDVGDSGRFGVIALLKCGCQFLRRESVGRGTCPLELPQYSSGEVGAGRDAVLILAPASSTLGAVNLPSVVSAMEGSGCGR